MLGILKSGAAYVPIDRYPLDRQTYIFKNSSCKLLLEPSLYEENHLSFYTTEDMPAIAGEKILPILYTLQEYRKTKRSNYYSPSGYKYYSRHKSKI